MRLFILFVLLLNNLLSYNPAVASLTPRMEIKELQVSYQFGLKASFQAWLTPPDAIKEIHLMIQPQGSATRVEKIPLNADGHILFEYDLAATPLPPFSPVDYWLRVTQKDGKQVESSHQTFLYEDNRFDWQTIESGTLVVKWYSGDLAFGQMVMDVATQGMEKSRQLVNATPPQPLRIYVYPAATDLQSALALINSAWVAGHADPEFATVLVSLPPGPGQRLEMERQLPHEITHILLYQAYGANYTRLPAWLNEGLASLSELYPNADYKRALQKAGQNNSLIPMEMLCGSFPREASGAYLAYAQAESFTRFLEQKYGTPSLQELAGLYADGVNCQQGIQTTFETSLGQAELRWKQEYLGINAEQLAWQSLLPYLVLLLLVLIPAIAGGMWLWRKK